MCVFFKMFSVKVVRQLGAEVAKATKGFQTVLQQTANNMQNSQQWEKKYFNQKGRSKNKLNRKRSDRMRRVIKY